MGGQRLFTANRPGANIEGIRRLADDNSQRVESVGLAECPQAAQVLAGQLRILFRVGVPYADQLQATAAPTGRFHSASGRIHIQPGDVCAVGGVRRRGHGEQQAARVAYVDKQLAALLNAPICLAMARKFGGRLSGDVEM